MKDLIIPLNNEAMSRALIAVVGEEHTKVILEAYRLIDAAMLFGYQKSQEEEAGLRKTLAEDYVASLLRNDERPQSFKAGYDMGYSDAKEELGDTSGDQQESYDDGYVDGVSDSRVFPQYADAQVAWLCSSVLSAPLPR